MKLVPDTENILAENVIIQRIPSLTYRVQQEKEIVSGTVEELEAMKQAVFKILFTERYRYEIYNWEYGIELSDLFGRAKSYVIPEIKKRIEEALLADDRIKAVTDFEFGGEKESLEVKFRVHTIFGVLDIQRQVDI
ncbi:MAG TPA: DUF2634 domain-containing protein [Candidatus Coprocola pullicola]|nr:DUF2634 domain-containing protein [Candidatus Coprocola pullicola]